MEESKNEKRQRERERKSKKDKYNLANTLNPYKEHNNFCKVSSTFPNDYFALVELIVIPNSLFN